MVIKLYIAGESEKSRHSVENVQVALKRIRKDPDLLEVVDVLQQPYMAIDDQILATPTLLIQSAGGERRFIGDFSDSEKVLKILDFEIIAFSEGNE